MSYVIWDKICPIFTGPNWSDMLRGLRSSGNSPGDHVFRLSKTTDYGIVLLAGLARDPSAEPRNARELAEGSDLPVPMASKILKALAKEGLLVSQRGSKGGYRLARDPAELSVSEMVRVLEGPVALTDCAIGPSLCEHEAMCAVREPWQLISRVVEQALSDVTLADLVRGRPSPAFASVVEMLQIELSEKTERSTDEQSGGSNPA
jgi:FeS assembly SUF system regulator